MWSEASRPRTPSPPTLKGDTQGPVSTRSASPDTVRFSQPDVHSNFLGTFAMPTRQTLREPCEDFHRVKKAT